MKTRRVRVLAICGALLLTFTVAGGPVAQAASSGSNCAYRLDPVSYDAATHTVSADLVLIGCYDTFAAALAAGSGGAIQVSSSTTPGQLSDAMVSNSTTAAPTLIGTEWTSVNFSGVSSSYFAPDSCAGTVYAVSYVGDAWNDDFASGKGFGGCDTNKKFQHANFGGDVLTCTPNCSDYGALRNEVSSLKWRP
ncbi:MAG: hypothetical protein M3P10_08195 [Actinomycetota bacterium]|nr:hypothetical protein [Actinomycetota bacterium]